MCPYLVLNDGLLTGNDNMVAQENVLKSNFERAILTRYKYSIVEFPLTRTRPVSNKVMFSHVGPIAEFTAA